MIPIVKDWKVTVKMLDGSVKSTVVRTINKRFARMILQEEMGYDIFWKAEKVTVSVVRS